jgi:ribonuclease HI
MRYTDGSKTSKGLGAVMYSYDTRQKLSISFGQYTTVFQGEVYAIKACVVENLDRKCRNRNIYILSGSQAVIKALSNHRITSKLVWGCIQFLMLLAEHNRVQLIWGIDGHEMADQLAKLESERPFTELEPSCCNSKGVLKKAVRDLTETTGNTGIL